MAAGGIGCVVSFVAVLIVVVKFYCDCMSCTNDMLIDMHISEKCSHHVLSSITIKPNSSYPVVGFVRCMFGYYEWELLCID